ncbi:unnamed protein product [Calicophoron daubneyi]|uniref:Peptidase S54 rhomboid domain-containing protein n=1 Tax=Calicophoron daubneyi TaxID=300641 RepID=A0AAV2T6U3_CALDB
MSRKYIIDQSRYIHKLQKLNFSYNGIALCLLGVQILRIPFANLLHSPACDILAILLILIQSFHLLEDPIQFCASIETVVQQKKWTNVLLSHFCHINEWHVYHNLTGFLRNAVWIENYIGWQQTLNVFFILMVRSQIVHLFSNRILYYLTDDEVYAADCFIGISGLVFALNVITCLATDGSFDLTLPVMGEFHIKKSVLAWLDLLLIQFPLPTSSFVGESTTN